MASTRVALVAAHTADFGLIAMGASARGSAFSGRLHAWVEPRRPLACPQRLGDVEHQLKTNARVQSHNLLRCVHRPAAGQGECGAWVWVQMLPNGWRYVAVVTKAEVAFMEHRQMTLDESLAYLGTQIPPEAR
jgi:hypothetical protein